MDKKEASRGSNASVIMPQNFKVHIFTNFWRHEEKRGVEASNLVTCILDYLASQFKSDKKPIVLYSDGCGYQNRNINLSNALFAFAAKEKRIVEQKYLIKGDTQMECDSVHVLKVRQLKHRVVFVPAQYVSITKKLGEIHSLLRQNIFIMIFSKILQIQNSDGINH